MEIKNSTGKSYLNVPFDIKAEDIQDDGFFSGYGSLFDKTPDSHRDIVAKGAFMNTLKKGGRNRTGVAMLWQHRSDQIPGVWVNLEEDNKGLKSEGQLAIDTELGKSIHSIMKLGAEHGTFKFNESIGYDAVKYDVDQKNRIRTLQEVELWELSIVTFPAKLGATITTVKTLDDVKTERQLENYLREVGSLSKNDAQMVVKLCRPSLREAERDLGEGVYSELLGSLKTINEIWSDKKDDTTPDEGLGGTLNYLQELNQEV